MSASPPARLKELAVAAVLGADRSGADAAGLLTGAAAAALRARAGRRMVAAAGAPDLCPVDPTPAAGRAASATLDRLLTDPDAGLIEEWSRLAIAAGRRVPDAAAPGVLDWWSRQPQRSAEVFQALGARGAWLAGLNPAWKRPVVSAEVPADAESRWEVAAGAERAALLQTVRRADPARAMAMVRSTWSDDGADDRRKFLEVLAAAPRPEEEAFLEAALDDRSKLVRREAARVLTRLPGSALRGRMNARAAAIIAGETQRKGLLRRQVVKITITPPQAFDKGWERDGIEEQVAGGKGKRAWWMRQILAAADLSVWTNASGLAPAETLEAAREDDFYADALLAILEAAGVMNPPPDLAWARALLAEAAGRKELAWEALAPLWTGRARDESEALRLEAAGVERFAPAARWRILGADERPWSPTFSGRALALLKASAGKKLEGWELWSGLDQASRLIATEAAGALEDVVGSLHEKDMPDGIRKILDRVRLRADMHREFQA